MKTKMRIYSFALFMSITFMISASTNQSDLSSIPIENNCEEGTNHLGVKGRAVSSYDPGTLELSVDCYTAEQACVDLWLNDDDASFVCWVYGKDGIEIYHGVSNLYIDDHDPEVTSISCNATLQEQ